MPSIIYSPQISKVPHGDHHPTPTPTHADHPNPTPTHDDHQACSLVPVTDRFSTKGLVYTKTFVFNRTECKADRVPPFAPRACRY